MWHDTTRELIASQRVILFKCDTFSDHAETPFNLLYTKQSLHDTALVRIRCSASILPQVCGCLLYEIAGLVETHPISFRVTHSLADAEVI
jgi:hypothetical protein